MIIGNSTVFNTELSSWLTRNSNTVYKSRRLDKNVTQISEIWNNNLMFNRHKLLIFHITEDFILPLIKIILNVKISSTLHITYIECNFVDLKNHQLRSKEKLSLKSDIKTLKRARTCFFYTNECAYNREQMWLKVTQHLRRILIFAPAHGWPFA